MSATPNVSTGVAETWAEYDASEEGAWGEAELKFKGKWPRRVVMKEDGDLIVSDAFGVPKPLTGLPAWFNHEGAISVIDETQAADLIIYW